MRGCRAPRVEDVLQVLSAMPEAWFRKEDVDDWVRDQSDPTGLHSGVHAPQLPTDAAFLSTHLPLWASMVDQPVGSIEDTFTRVAGKYVAEIRWECLGWPEVPERGLYADFKHAEVTVLFNAATREMDEWSNGHTALVHVRRRNGDGYEERHASWLAEQVGRPSSAHRSSAKGCPANPPFYPGCSKALSQCPGQPCRSSSVLPQLMCPVIPKLKVSATGIRGSHPTTGSVPCPHD